MKSRTRRASKRRIPKEPGKSMCSFTFEVDGEIVLMKVDCAGSCKGKEFGKDICWSSLVRAISDTALPDRIMLCGEQTVICDRILVSLIRNAAMLVRRIETRLEELRRVNRPESLHEEKRLKDLIRAMLYDVPQLINRDFDSAKGKCEEYSGEKSQKVRDDFSLAGEILSGKSGADLSALGPTAVERTMG
jgi:ribosomal protein S17E